jgi:hypothetical protein
MVAKRHKITNVPLFKKLWDIILFFWDNNFYVKIMSRSFLNSGTLIVSSCSAEKLDGNVMFGKTAVLDLYRIKPLMDLQ